MESTIQKNINAEIASQILQGSRRRNRRGTNPNSLMNLKGFRSKVAGEVKSDPPENESEITSVIQSDIEVIDPVIPSDSSDAPTGSNTVSAVMHRLLSMPCPVDKDHRLWKEVLAEAAFEMAIDKPEAMRIVLDRLEGKPVQPIAGPGGGPIQTRTEIVAITGEDLKPALEALIACGVVKIGQQN